MASDKRVNGVVPWSAFCVVRTIKIDGDGLFTDETVLIDDTTHIDGTWNAGYVGLFTGPATTHAAQEFDDVTMLIDNDADGTIDEELFSDDFSSNSVTLSYDDNGNLTFDGVHTFVYDGWNRLRRARMVAMATTDVATYEYYGDNRRSEKIVQNQGAEAVDNDGGNTTVRYYYCGTGVSPVSRPVSAWNICETRNGSDQTTFQYVWGTKYTDELIMIEKNLAPEVDNDADPDTLTAAENPPLGQLASEDARYLVHQDRNWNVIALTDYDKTGTNAGVVVERYSYTPYGRFVVLKGDSSGNQLGNVLMTSAVGNVFTHQGLPFDHEKGSYQNRWREYAPRLRRFAQKDPFGYADGQNLYAYTACRPNDVNDPLGLCLSWPMFFSCLGGGPVGAGLWAACGTNCIGCAALPSWFNPFCSGCACCLGVSLGALINCWWIWC